MKKNIQEYAGLIDEKELDNLVGGSKESEIQPYGTPATIITTISAVSAFTLSNDACPTSACSKSC